jgi:hypothetical protein
MTHALPEIPPDGEIREIEFPGDAVPPQVRTWAYALGTFVAVGVVPALIAAGLDVPAGIASGLAGGALALAFGYRPTR